MKIAYTMNGLIGGLSGKNSSGSNINRTFDFVAIGHGLKSSS